MIQEVTQSHHQYLFDKCLLLSFAFIKHILALNIFKIILTLRQKHLFTDRIGL